MTRVILVFMTVCLCGCVPFYVPVPQEKAHHKDDFKSVEVGVTTREEILQLLGPPQVERENKKLWIYRAPYLHGYIGVVGVSDVTDPGQSGEGGVGKNYQHQYIFVEFLEDKVNSFELVEPGFWDSTEDFFSSGGVILTQIWTTKNQKLSSNDIVIVASKRDDDLAAKTFRAKPNVCLIYLYSKDYIAIGFSVDFSEDTWINRGTYSLVESEPGVVNIAFMNGYKHYHGVYVVPDVAKKIEKKVECRSEEVVFVQFTGDSHFIGVWTERIATIVDAKKGERAIRKRYLLIPPDSSPNAEVSQSEL